MPFAAFSLYTYLFIGSGFLLRYVFVFICLPLIADVGVQYSYSMAIVLNTSNASHNDICQYLGVHMGFSFDMSQGHFRGWSVLLYLL